MAERTCSIDGCERERYSRGWCSKHYKRWLKHRDLSAGPLPFPERFWVRVDKHGQTSVYRPDLGACWLWTGPLNQGYGTFLWRSDPGYASSRVHRIAYEIFNGPIPEGMQIDHLCRIRHCCNPAHLEAVTHQENIRRGLHGLLRTHCRHGHLLDEANLRVNPSGGRVCRRCACDATKRCWRRKHPPSGSA